METFPLQPGVKTNIPECRVMIKMPLDICLISPFITLPLAEELNQDVNI